MSQDDKKPSGPDLSKGIASSDLAEGAMLSGLAGEDEVLLVRKNGRVSALAAHCTHYHGPLADGLVIGNTVRCPWHHACFDLATGEALTAPALSPLACYEVSERDGKITVGAKKEPPAPKPRAAASRKASTGKVSFSSQSRACGIMASRANCRAVAWKARCSSVREKSMGISPPAYPD